MTSRVIAAAALLFLAIAAQTQAARPAWTNIGPEQASPITAFAAAPDGTLYVAAGQSVYRSSDGGLHWQSRSPLPSTVRALAVDRTQPTTLWALHSTAPAYVSRSTDGAQTWIAGAPFAFYQAVESLAVSADGSVLYAGGSIYTVSYRFYFCEVDTGTAGYRSSDQDSSWTYELVAASGSARSFYPPLSCPQLPPAPSLELPAFDFFDSSLIYAAIPGALLRRSGATGWNAILVPGCLVTSIAASPVLPGHARAGLQSGGSASSCSLLLDTADGGQTFVPAVSPVSSESRANVTGLAFDSSDPNVQYVAVVVYSSPGGPSGQLVFETPDGGLSWRRIDWDPSLSIHQLAIAGSRILYAVSDRGIFARGIPLTRGETIVVRPRDVR